MTRKEWTIIYLLSEKDDNYHHHHQQHSLACHSLVTMPHLARERAWTGRKKWQSPWVRDFGYRLKTNKPLFVNTVWIKLYKKWLKSVSVVFLIINSLVLKIKNKLTDQNRSLAELPREQRCVRVKFARGWWFSNNVGNATFRWTNLKVGSQSEGILLFHLVCIRRF